MKKLIQVISLTVNKIKLLESQNKHEAENQLIRSTLKYKDDKTSGPAETSKEA